MPAAGDCPREGWCFERPEGTKVGEGASDLCAGVHDVIVVSSVTNELVQLSWQNGRLRESGRRPLLGRPWSVARGDLDGDGTEDLCVAHIDTEAHSGLVTWLMGLEPARWLTSAFSATGSDTYAVVIGPSVDGGQRPPLLAASFGASKVSEFRWNPGGGPELQATVELGMQPTAVTYLSGRVAGTPGALAVGVGLEAGELVVLRVGSSGELVAGERLALGEHPNAVSAGDLDEDGMDDAVVVDDIHAGELQVFLQQDDGFHRAGGVPVGVYPHSAELRDLDGDGHLDVATVLGGSTALSVCFGDGTGRLADCVTLEHGVSQPTDVDAADLDGDGRIDLMVSGYGGRVAVLRRRDP